MKTYQDIIEVGHDEKKRMDFILAAIDEHKSSDLYKTAVDANLYYKGENPTINNSTKYIYDGYGNPHVNVWEPNHKIASSFFGFVVRQENGYLLGNGVSFKDNATKDKLGNKKYTFDQQILKLGKNAIIGGISFGFWNHDHIDVFSIQEFVPLFDEENGAMKAGIRFWQQDNTKPLRATLFEIDGYTDYIHRHGEDMQIQTQKRPYITHVTADISGRNHGDMIYHGENYPGFPIVPLKYGEDGTSEIVGKRNTIDAYDLVFSNLINNVSGGNTTYWVIKNAGGMDAIDDWNFIQRTLKTKVVHGDGDEVPEPHNIEAPYESTSAALDALKAQLNADFMTFNSQDLSGGNRTATEIEEAYANLDLKVDDFEANVTEFINGILELLGIDDAPSYTRNKKQNPSEQANTLAMLAPYFDNEYNTTKGLYIMGDPDMADEVLKRQAAENLDRFDGTVETESERDR